MRSEEFSSWKLYTPFGNDRVTLSPFFTLFLIDLIASAMYPEAFLLAGVSPKSATEIWWCFAEHIATLSNRISNK